MAKPRKTRSDKGKSRSPARRSPARRSSYRSRAKGLLGGLGKGLTLKGIATGTAGLIAAQRLNPFGGIYKPAVDMVASGTVLGMLNMDNNDLVSSGIKVGLSTIVNQYLFGGNGVRSSNGGDTL